jgi:predicted phage terminase large subunit-like protein
MGVLKKTSRIFVIGTLLHPESFLARLIDHPREGWTTRFYQAIKKDGCPLWPEMWSLMELDRLRRELGSTAFRQEYMNEPLPDELRTFRREHIRYFDQEPEGCIYFTTIDPAIELKTTSDFSAIVTVAVDPDENMYVVEYINKRMLPSELIDSIFSTWLKWKSQVVGIETVGFQKMIKIEIDKERVKRRQYPVIVELKSEGRRKELRIQSLQPRFEAGKIYIRKGMDELETQLLRFPSPRCKDDLCDALAYTLEIIRPSHRPVTQMNPECFLAELERRRHYFHGRRGVWGNHKLQRV